MPITSVSTPNGQVVDVDHPEGATDEQIISFAYRDYVTNQDEDGLLVDVGKTILAGAAQTALNTGAGYEQIRGMLLSEDEDDRDEVINEFVAQQPPELGITADEVKQHRQKKKSAKDIALDNALRVRDLANNMGQRIGQDQDFAQSFAGQVVTGFSQVFQSLAAAATGGATGAAIGTAIAGPAGTVIGGTVGTIGGVLLSAFPQMVSESINDAERTLKKSYPEMNPEERNQVALSTLGYATLGTALESAGFLKAVPGLRRFVLGRGTLSAGVLKSLRREVAEGFAAEGFTEATQGQLLDAFAAATYDDDREQMSMQVLGQRFNEFLIGGIVGGGTAGAVGAFERAANGTLFQPRTKEVTPEVVGEKRKFVAQFTDKETGTEIRTSLLADTLEEANQLAFESYIDTDIALPDSLVVQEEDKSEGADVEEEEEVAATAQDIAAEAAAVGLTPQEFNRRLEGTKVVNDEAKPIRVYRGTRNIEFETEGRGRVPSFTSSPDVASTYSSTIGGGPFNIRLSFKEGASVSPVFLSMKKPLDFTAEDNFMSLGNYLAYMEYGNDKNGITKEEVDKLINYMVRRGRGKTKAKGDFVFRLEDVYVNPRFDLSRDEYSDLIDFKSEYDDYLDNNLSLEDAAIQDGLYFDQFIAADAPVTKIVAKRLGFDGIIHKDAFGLKEEYEKLTGKKVEGLTQEKREDGLSIIEDDIHITYRPFSKDQIISGISGQQQDVVAEAATGPVSTDAAAERIKLENLKPQANEDFFQFWTRILDETGTRFKASSRNFGRVAKQAVQDTLGFFRDNPRFADYYETDARLTREYVEAVTGPITEAEFNLYRILAGLTSPSTKLPDNITDALRVFKLYKENGNFNFIVPTETAKGAKTYDPVKTGFKFRSTTGATKATSILAVQKKIDEIGLEATIEYLTEPVTMEELVASKQSLGYKDVGKKAEVKQVVRQATNQDTLIPRMFMFGPKVGAYSMNTLGNVEYTTTDIWESRFIRSYFKGMMEAGTGLPENVDEQKIFQEFSSAFNEEFKKQTGLNLEPASLQAVRWFYILNAFQKTGYQYAKTDDTISGYTAKAARELYGIDPEGGRPSVEEDARQVDEAVAAEATEVDIEARATAAQQPSSPEGGFNSINEMSQSIQDNFKPVVSKVGVEIQENDSVREIQYNVSQGVIEYNPRVLFESRSQEGIQAAMREEIIHAAMHKVLMQRSPSKSRNNAWLDFMGGLGKDLTQEQRDAISGVYTNLQSDSDFGAEYSRAAIQYLLYGGVTEQYVVGGKAWSKIQKLFKAVQTYLARTLGKDIETNTEAAAVIRDSVDLVLKSDPTARITNQTIAQQARKKADGTVDTDVIVNADKAPSKKKAVNAFDKYFFTASSVLSKIHPEFTRLFQQYFDRMGDSVLKSLKTVRPFIQKFNGIQNQKDKKRLKQLLYYSPSVTERTDIMEQQGIDPEALLRERDQLLAKYNMLNDYSLYIIPVLARIRSNAQAQGIEVGELSDYFPRRVKDLDGLRESLGQPVAEDFRSYIDRINFERGREQDTSKKKPLIERGSTEEALEFEKYLRSGGYTQSGITPRNLNQRTYEFIRDEDIDFYADPGEAIESYIQAMVTATETKRFIGKRYEVDGSDIILFPKEERPGELGLLIQDLLQRGEIDEIQAFQALPDFTKMILNPMMKENPTLGALRTFSYFTLLVEPTSTISQIFDLPFQMFENGFFRTVGSMVGGKTFRLEDVGISNEDISAEFRNETKLLNDALRIGLRATGFARLDQLMKETNLNANYRRIRSQARGYLKNRNAGQSKKLKTELDFLLGNDADAAIAAFADGDRNNPLVREVLLRKLLETQPVNILEMPLSVAQNPNLRMLYTMKSFMIKQLTFVKDRMLVEMFGADKTPAQRLRGAADLSKLMFFMMLVGMPADALKDFLAGRAGYLSDYIFNGIGRVFGISRYQAYVARKEGIGQAVFDFVTPVAIQQGVDNTAELQRVLSGEKAITDSKLVTLAPLSDVLNRIFGFSQERELKEFKRRQREGEAPLFIPPGAF